MDHLALVDPCDHCVNKTQNWETKDSSLRINFVLETGDQRQPGCLFLSRFAGMGGRELLEQGWKRTFLNNEGLSSFAEMGDYNVEACYWELLYNVKSLFSTLFLCQMQIIKCWQYTQLIITLTQASMRSSRNPVLNIICQSTKHS